MHPRKLHLLSKGHGLLVFGLGFAAEPGNDIGGDGAIGHGLPQKGHRVGIFGGGVAAAHTGKHRVRPALQGKMELAADFFIMPLSTDIFSLMAIDNIDTSFSNWRKDLQSGTERFQENNLEYFEKMKTLISWDLSFLGFVTQQYRAKRKEGVPVPVKAFETIRLRQAERLETFCQNFHMSYEEANLGEIPTLSSVIPLSQEANIPIAKLTSEHGIVGSNFNRVKEAGDFYKNVANKIILSIEGDA